MTCIISNPLTPPIRAIDNMGITLTTSSTEFDPRAIVRAHLARLTPREFEICVLHFVEHQSQLQIAEWLGMDGRTLREHIQNAVKKVPQLKRLRIKSRVKPTRPKILHLSQLRPTERGPFNADEV